MRLWTQEPPQVGTALARRTRRDKLQISLAHWRRLSLRAIQTLTEQQDRVLVR